MGDGNGWSRLTDGDLKSYWKSNPYLTKAYTGDDDSLHPQWVMIDLGAKVDVNAIRIAWADPYARRYYVQFWTGEQEPFYNGINKGAWQTFPMGTIAGRQGRHAHAEADELDDSRALPAHLDDGIVQHLRHARRAGQAQLRGVRDQRTLHRHRLGRRPVHRHRQAPAQPAADHHLAFLGGSVARRDRPRLRTRRPDRTRFLLQLRRDARSSGHDPGGAALRDPGGRRQRNRVPRTSASIPISWIEMGEEADGQRVLPEDYADAVPSVREGDPQAGARRRPWADRPIEGTPGDVDSWADANGRVSFLGRFVDYLKARDRLQDFTFFSFEHYPCMGGRRCADWSSLYWEPAYVNRVIQAWKDNGLPPNVPFFMTEGNDLGEGGAGTVKSGLWLADYVGAMMTAGASGTYYFHYIATGGRGGGGGGFLPIDENNRVRSYPPQYLATQVITKEWVQPVDAIHKLFKVASDVKDRDGNILVTAYAVERPDGQWSVMLVNKDQDNDHAVKVTFADPAAGRNRFFSGAVDRVVFGAAEYQWHPDPVPPGAEPPAAGRGGGRGRGAISGHADPDGPPSKSSVTAGGPDTQYHLPKASIIVLRGKLSSL